VKYVIILLLSVSGVEQIKYPIKKSFLSEYPTEYSYLACSDQADEWREKNTTHYWEINGDPTLHGHYTQSGRLMIGYICN
jgi:hypothetical protein